MTTKFHHNKTMRKTIFILLFIVSFATVLNAQTTLFEYPSAPDTCSTIGSRCDYSVKHFWDKCDFNKPFAQENDSLLLQAMVDYIEIMTAGADLRVSVASIRDMMNKAQANHTNFMRLAAMAEFLLYMRPVDIVDDIYLAFAQSVVDATWLDKEKNGKIARQHFKDQVGSISASKLNEVITDIEFTGNDGRKHRISEFKGNEITFLVFVDNKSESDIALTRLNSDITISNAIKEGHIKIIALTLKQPAKWDGQWQTLANDGWVIGVCKDADKVIDIRMFPCVLVLDKDLRVLAKNLSVDRVKAMLGN